ncbi:MAG: LysR substrate-binding domain-containing protein [Rhodobacteraceae bacterium]|uniref:LysR substrate-binding domain-containing protein n=1 Tax=Marivita sp. TaxID=2003365 RepID=UPI003B51BCAB|nr:LysR substrate-binding domain-containing protein [Paracoccaceae bacterium]
MARRLPNLKQLRAFEAAARHGSFKDAAVELNVTQAAVSHQVKALEQDLSVLLFHRRTRRIDPTEEALVYAKALNEALDIIERATSDLGTGRMEGTLKISCAPYYGNRMLLPRLARFHAAHRGIKIMPEMDSTVIDFGKSNLNAGLRYGAGNWAGLAEIKLHSDFLIPVAAPSMLDGRNPPLEPHDIASMTLGFVGGQDAKWERWFESVGYTGPVPATFLQYGNRARVIDLAFSGHGVALGDKRLLQEDLNSGRLVQLHPHGLEGNDAMYVVFPKAPTPDPRVILFAEWLRDDLANE